MIMTIIDAVALLNNVDSWELDRYSKQYVKKMIKSMKIEGIERIRHGHWGKLYTNNYKCSVCGSWWTDDGDTYLIDFNYCPHCGAKLDGGVINGT